MKVVRAKFKVVKDYAEICTESEVEKKLGDDKSNFEINQTYFPLLSSFSMPCT